MSNNDLLKHPLIEVSIGGSVTEKRASEFRLYTQSGFHSVTARLLYPADSEAGNAGDKITVSLVSDKKTDLYFTGEVHTAARRDGYRELILTDSYKKLCGTDFTAAYRKEKASFILDDILAAAGITEKSVTCPDVELARFSTLTIKCRNCLDLLIDALKEHGVTGINYFFDEKDVFHFGTKDDTGKNDGEAFGFENAKEILRRGTGWIEVLPRPVRHTQTVTVDGKEAVTVRTELRVSRRLTRLVLWTGEA
jgi:hypothetical protein